jgi:outer membrane cobalamin receptor
VLALVAGNPVFSQQDDPLEEVVVSGYRQQPARELGLSLSVLDAQDIERAAVSRLEELIPLVPNFNLSGEGSRARYLQIRGIGEREQYEGVPNPSVGFYLDDIDLSGISGIAGVFDLDSVEVLRGPQSSRFGGSALAGVVYATSTDPREDVGNRVALSVGEDDFRSTGIALGGQLSANTWGRISVHGDRSDGFRDNAWTGSATNRRNEMTAHGKLAWQAGDDWEALLTLLYADNDNGYDAWTVRNDDITHSDRPGQDQQTTTAGSLRVARALPAGGEFQSISALSSSDILFSFDGDWGNTDFWQDYGGYVYDYQYANPRQRDSLSQELRLVSAPGAIGGHTDWVLGVF